MPFETQNLAAEGGHCRKGTSCRQIRVMDMSFPCKRLISLLCLEWVLIILQEPPPNGKHCWLCSKQVRRT